MIPVPFLKRIPKLFQTDSKAINMATKIDANLLTWKQETTTIEWIRRCDQCPAVLLDELGALLNAGLKNEDGDATKRKKVCEAILNHKNRGTWDDDAKLRIQAITGIEPELFNNVDNDDWIWLGKEADDPDRYWATWGTDGVDDDLGIWVVGDFTEYVISGNIYIDLKTSTLTAEEIEQIKNELSTDVVPAYYVIYLGYIAGGVFVVYANGIID